MTERKGIKYARYSLIGVLILGLAVLPQIITNPYLLSLFTFIAIYAIVGIGLSLLMGYAGQISLGQAAFFGIGAYASGVLTAKQMWDPWIAMVAAALLTGIIAALTGGIILRFQGHVLAVATLALTIIVYILLVQLEPITGGLSPGLPGIPRLSILGLKLNKDFHYFYLSWAALLVLLFLASNIVHSRVGRALRSFHHFYGGSEQAAESVGVNPTLLKVQVFALSAMYASIAGSIYAHYISYLNPSPFGIFMSLQLMVMVILGGLRSLWGAILGAATVMALGEALRAVVPMLFPKAFGEYQIIAYGVIMIVILLMAPEGMVQIPRIIWAALRGIRSKESQAPQLASEGVVAQRAEKGS